MKIGLKAADITPGSIITSKVSPLGLNWGGGNGVDGFIKSGLNNDSKLDNEFYIIKEATEIGSQLIVKASKIVFSPDGTELRGLREEVQKTFGFLSDGIHPSLMKLTTEEFEKIKSKLFQGRAN